METVTGSLSVFFEEPFWVAVYELDQGGCRRAAKVVFGAEPKDGQVYEYFLKNWGRLRLSPPVAGAPAAQKPRNPKRVQREIRSRLSQTGTGTKSQQALALLLEQQKQEGTLRRRRRSEEEEERRFLLRQEKKREKHRGH